MIFFLFLKIILKINASKQFKIYKKNLIFNKFFFFEFLVQSRAAGAGGVGLFCSIKADD